MWYRKDAPQNLSPWSVSPWYIPGRKETRMIRESLFSLAFLKKEVFYGSYQKMQYRIAKKEDELEVCIYPGPFNFDHTPQEQKETRTFPFGKEGYEQAKDWLEEAFREKDWEALAAENS